MCSRVRGHHPRPPPPQWYPPSPVAPPATPPSPCCCGDLPLLLRTGGAAVPLPTRYGTQPLLCSVHKAKSAQQ